MKLSYQYSGSDEKVSVTLNGDIISNLVSSLYDALDDVREENKYLSRELAISRQKVLDYQRKPTFTKTTTKKRKTNMWAARFSGNVRALPPEVKAEAREFAKTNGYEAAVEWIKNWRTANSK